MTTTLTDAELARLEELAAKASNLPWANTDTVFELFGVHPDDWWKIYAKKPEEVGVYPYFTVCSMSFRATDEEVAEARRVSWSDHSKMYDPGQAGNDARYIAAACNAVPSLVAEVRALRRHGGILRNGNKAVRDGLEAENAALRSELEQMKHGMTAAYMVGKAGEGDLQAENAALRERVEALEWLVECMDNYEWCCNRSGWFIAHGVHHEAKATLDAAREAIS